MATNTKESRRRKIVERGSDRLAFITGRIQNLPPASSEPLHSLAESSPEISFDNHMQQSDQSTQTSVTSHGEDNLPGAALAKNETSNESSHNGAIGNESRTDLQLQNSETSNESSRNGAIGNESRTGLQLQNSETSVNHSRAVPLDASNVETSASMNLSSAAQNLLASMVGAEPSTEPRRHHSKISTARRISSSISASERTRLLCSIGIALIVVLSHLNVPLLGNSFLRSTIGLRPVYLIMLTDVSIVLALLLFEKKGHSYRAHEETRQPSPEDGYSWVEVLGMALEMFLVLRKAITAAFLDCSVYVVIVVCGVSMLQHWFRK